MIKRLGGCMWINSFILKQIKLSSQYLLKQILGIIQNYIILDQSVKSSLRLEKKYTISTFFFQVCDDVTEIQCEIQPYTECQMTMEVETYKGNEVVQKTFEKKLCQEAMDVVQHTKMMPECRNVTKQNCITKWETDEDGNQAS